MAASMVCSGVIEMEERFKMDMILETLDLNTLETFPEEVLLHIFEFLDPVFVSKTLSLVCQRFKRILSNKTVWKVRLMKHLRAPFPYIPEMTKDQNFPWRESCVRVENERLRWRKNGKYVQNIYSKRSYSLIDATHIMSNGLVAAGSRDHQIQLMKVDGDDVRREAVLEAHKGWVWCLDSVGDNLASGAWDSSINLWDVNRPDTSLLNYRYQVAILSMAFRENMLISGTYNKRILISDPRSSLEPIAALCGQEMPIIGLTMNDELIVSGSADRTIAIWCKRTRKLINKLNIPNKGLVRSMIMPYDRSLLFGDNQGCLHLVDMKKEPFAIANSWSIPGGKICSMAGGESSLITGHQTGEVKIWQPTNPPKVEATLGDSLSHPCVNVSYRDGLLCVSYNDNMMKLWKCDM